MTYPPDFESKLGFNGIRQKLKSYCLSDLGVDRVEEIEFSSSLQVVSENLNLSLELMKIRESGETFPLTDCFDPRRHFQLIGIEDSFLEEEILRSIAASLKSILTCCTFLAKFRTVYPFIYSYSEKIVLPIQVVEEIQNKFDDVGRIKDGASPELHKIRRRLKEEESRARKLISKIFNELNNGSVVPEGSQPVLREGRVAIPVRAEYKRKVKGIIMDESASGQTVYIEPSEVVEANNEIRDLQLEERREVVKILKELTGLLRQHFDEVRLCFEFLSLLDLLQAKAKLAIELDGQMPEIRDTPALNWLNARHPLLVINNKDRGEVVPLNIELTDESRYLLVSGPNAGGKSVCLKTVGLIQYMAQSGLLVPLAENSKVGIFENIFIDIGDQQSIENDLSTYSSHLRNLNYFVDQSTSSTLILMDELGAGTDPNFGGGIAEAILEFLLAKNVWGIATTHYYNLKVFASNTKGIRNGAMLFDSKELRPLFQLEIDKPGSSFALEIASKTGLPKSILDRAEEIIGEELAGLETLMKEVADKQLQLQKREAKVRKEEVECHELLERYKELTGQLELSKREIINKAKEEAAMILNNTNREIEKTIRHIQENKAEKKETRKVRQNLKSLSDKIKHVDKSVSTIPTEIKVGDHVRFLGQERSGIVQSIKGQNAVVQFGEIRSTTKLGLLTKSDSGKSDPPVMHTQRMGMSLHMKQSNFNSTLDVRGKRVEEVFQLIDSFLDDAILLGYGELKILHGKGEGVLRKVIRERLKTHKAVALFHDEHVDRGGDGITVVVLK